MHLLHLHIDSAFSLADSPGLSKIGNVSNAAVIPTLPHKVGTNREVPLNYLDEFFQVCIVISLAPAESSVSVLGYFILWHVNDIE